MSDLGDERMMRKRWLGWVMMGWPSLPLLASCGAPLEPSRSVRSKLETLPLVITEVAQATPYDGNRPATRSKSFAANAGGCSAFKVCDPTTGGGTSCSAAPARARRWTARGDFARQRRHRRRSGVARGQRRNRSSQVRGSDRLLVATANRSRGRIARSPSLAPARRRTSA